jgi:hypothetical protein
MRTGHTLLSVAVPVSTRPRARQSGSATQTLLYYYLLLLDYCLTTALLLLYHCLPVSTTSRARHCGSADMYVSFRTDLYLCTHTHTHVYLYISFRADLHICTYIHIYTFRSHAGDSLHYIYTYVSIRQHTSAYVSIRQHTSAYVCQHTSAYVELFPITPMPLAPLYICIRQHTSAYVRIRHIYICVYIYIYIYIYIHMCMYISQPDIAPTSRYFLPCCQLLLQTQSQSTMLQIFVLLDLPFSLFISFLPRSVTYSNPRSSNPLPPLKRPRLTET